MPTKYTIQPSDWLSKIAFAHKFQDGGEAIENANPQLSALIKGNRNVLPVGYELTIPDKTEGEVGEPSNSSGRADVSVPKKNIYFTFLDSKGNTVSSDWRCEYRINGEGEQKPIYGTPAEGKVINFPEKKSLVEIFIGPNSEKVKLHVGGMEPLINVDGTPSIQAAKKILTNLGFYKSTVDGVDNDNFRAALRCFQIDVEISKEKITGLMDAETLDKLIEKCGVEMAIPTKPESIRPPLLLNKPKTPVSISLAGKDMDTETEIITKESQYEEPDLANPGHGYTKNPRTKIKLNKLKTFLPDVYVAPSDQSGDGNNNNIRTPIQKFLFLDSGRFYGKSGRDFSVIWGSNVYLCTFQNIPNTVSIPSDSNRLDEVFFAVMGNCVTIERKACAYWAPESDFDWDKIYLVIADMHLMIEESANIWHDGDNKGFKTEKDFLEFAKRLQGIANLPMGDSTIKNHLELVQVGDSYDLWVGYPRYFKGNKEGKVILEYTSKVDVPRFHLGDNPAAYIKKIKKWVDAHRNSTVASEADIIAEISERNNQFTKDFGAWMWDNEYGFLQVDAYVVQWLDDHNLPYLIDHSGASGYIYFIEDKKNELILNLATSIEKMLSEKSDDECCWEISTWIDAIKVDNPAIQGLDILENTFKIAYLHGNHDNYLVLDKVTIKAGIQKRVGFKEFPGVLIEHGHRLEGTFDGNNYDGAISGHRLTNALFKTGDAGKKMEDDEDDLLGIGKLLGLGARKLVPLVKWGEGKVTSRSDPPKYRKEYAQVWAGRKIAGKKPIHIFVIGHTHCPSLTEVDVEFEI
jgi:hypothetical protein